MHGTTNVKQEFTWRCEHHVPSILVYLCNWLYGVISQRTIISCSLT